MTFFRKPDPAVQLPPLAVDIEEAARMCAVSPHTIRRQIQAGKLTTRRIGRRIVITMASLEKFLRGEGA